MRPLPEWESMDHMMSHIYDHTVTNSTVSLRCSGGGVVRTRGHYDALGLEANAPSEGGGRGR